MPTSSDNISEWKKLSDIDYFTQYIKSWLAFNAWMRHTYSYTQDRQIIDEVKNTNNRFKNQIRSYLTTQGVESDAFKQFISTLHYELERHPIYNRNERISFKNVFIGPNRIRNVSDRRNRIDYTITIQTNNHVANLIVNGTGEEILNYEQDKYDINELDSIPDFTRLTSTQKSFFKALYREVNPRKLEDIVPNTVNDLKIGDYRFVDDRDKIARGVIEVLYSLRNVLFHAEIVPDRDKNDIYNPAYFILKSLIKVL